LLAERVFGDAGDVILGRSEADEGVYDGRKEIKWRSGYRSENWEVFIGRVA
jgi:hypothetical protein